MALPALDEYLETVEPDFRELVRRADAAVRASGAEFDVAVKYRMLMYTLQGDWRHWVVAVSQTKKAVNVRFLAGTMMSDPAGLLRPGSSTLMTLDFGSADDFDPALVTSYAAEAAGLFEAYREAEKNG